MSLEVVEGGFGFGRKRGGLEEGEEWGKELNCYMSLPFFFMLQHAFHAFVFATSTCI